MKKTALITGASCGLGYSFAHVFAREGYNLVLVARNGERLEEIKREIEEKYSSNVTVIAKDLCKSDSAKEIYVATETAGINIDVLVNNAGSGDFGEFHKCDLDKQVRMVQLNCIALMELCRYYLPAMVGRGSGNVVNVDSIAAFQPGPLMSVYYATKAFVFSFSQALTRELKGSGVKVMALCPGPIRTNFDVAANFGESGLFKNLKVWSPDVVAEFGYKNMKKGKSYCVIGLMNKLMVFSTRLAPRALISETVYQIQKVQ